MPVDRPRPRCESPARTRHGRSLADSSSTDVGRQRHFHTSTAHLLPLSGSSVAIGRRRAAVLPPGIVAVRAGENVGHRVGRSLWPHLHRGRDLCMGPPRPDSAVGTARLGQPARVQPRRRTLYLMDTPYGSAPLPVWERPEPQPRAAPVPLSRAKIAATAIRLADAHGLDGLSVRKIAKELGVGPMRLYDYVINRSELLDLMVDTVYAQIAEAGQHSEWRATVLAIVHRTRDAVLDHEWFSDLLGGRPHLGPHALAVGEATAAALSQAPGVRGIDEAAWQASLVPYLTRILKTGTYPTGARLIIDGAHLNADESFNHTPTTE